MNYLRSFSNVKTRLLIEGLEDGYSCLAYLRVSSHDVAVWSSLWKGQTVLMLEAQAVGKYELELFLKKDESISSIWRGVLEVNEGITSFSGVMDLPISHYSLHVATLQLSPVIVSIEAGGGDAAELPSWLNCIHGDASGISHINIAQDFMLARTDGVQPLALWGNNMYLGSGVQVLTNRSDTSVGF